MPQKITKNINEDESDNISHKSNYPELEKPSFHDNIPSHLLVNIDEKDRYVIQQLSMISQQNEWLIRAAIDTNEQVRHTNGRVKGLEAFKSKLQDKNVENKLLVLDKIFNFWTISAAFILGASSIVGMALGVLKALKYIP
jgi:hypothetical protein